MYFARYFSVQAVYPIPIKGSTLREDLHALEACRLIKIERAANEAVLPPGTGSRPTAAVAAAAAAAAEVTGGSTDGKGAAARAPRASHHHQRLLLSFRDLVIHQVRSRQRDRPRVATFVLVFSRGGKTSARDRRVSEGYWQRHVRRVGCRTDSNLSTFTCLKCHVVSSVISLLATYATHALELSLRQVVYKRLSHNHRNQLHGNIADWLSERQQQSSKTVSSGLNYSLRRMTAYIGGPVSSDSWRKRDREINANDTTYDNKLTTEIALNALAVLKGKTEFQCFSCDSAFYKRSGSSRNDLLLEGRFRN